jgi:hypothetical protein
MNRVTQTGDIVRQHPEQPTYQDIQTVYPDGHACQYHAYRVLVDTDGDEAWRKTQRKSGWSSWTAAGAAAGINGCRAAMSDRRCALSAKVPDGTGQRWDQRTGVERHVGTRLYALDCKLVGPPRLELGTRQFAAIRSTGLSYGPPTPPPQNGISSSSIGARPVAGDT